MCNVIDKINIFEISVCSKPVNVKSGFVIISKSNMKNDNENDNVQIYQHLYDTTHFIYEKMITNKNIFLIGNEEDFSILYLFIVAYLIRYGKLSMQHSLQFLNSKIFIQSFRYHNALFQFYNENK